MERDNDAGMSSDGIMYGGDASFGAPDQAQLSTFHTASVFDVVGYECKSVRGELGAVPGHVPKPAERAL